jgi:hypothetical protein
MISAELRESGGAALKPRKQETALLEEPEVEARLTELVHSLSVRRAVVVGARASSLSLPVAWELAPTVEAGRLPYPNQSVDLLVIDDPRSLVSPIELGALLREGWRVTGAACVLVSADHDPIEEARLELVAREVITGPIKTLRVGGGSILVALRQADAPGLQQSLARLEQQLWAAQTHSAHLRSELNRTEKERDVAQLRLTELEKSLPGRLSDNGLTRRLVQPVQAVSNRLARFRKDLRARGLSWPDSFTDDEAALAPEPDLRFAGIATRARPADPDAFMRARPDTVALCHPNWRGIRAATLDQVEHVIEVPGFESSSHALRLAGFLRDAGAERVVMNGYPPGTELLANAIAEAAPRIQFSVVYHGTPALSYGEDVVLQAMLELYQRGRLHKLGFVKHGLAEYFRYRGARAEWVMNRCSMPPLPPSPVLDGRLQIGVFAPSASHKNVETQLIAALLVPGAEVHTIEPVKAAYLQAESHRVHSHGLKPRPEFLELLRTMHAATYVSLVECYPMTVLESIFSGVICVTSNTSVLFDDVPELHEALVVAHHDSPAAIARKISGALEQRDTLIPRAQAHLQELNVRAEQRWNEFLKD